MTTQRPTTENQAASQAGHRVGATGWIHSDSVVEAMRAAAIILNEALILGSRIFGY
jgi:hypothetical protein